MKFEWTMTTFINIFTSGVAVWKFQNYIRILKWIQQEMMQTNQI